VSRSSKLRTGIVTVETGGIFQLFWDRRCLELHLVYFYVKHFACECCILDLLVTLNEIALSMQQFQWELKLHPGAMSPACGGFRPDDPTQINKFLLMRTYMMSMEVCHQILFSGSRVFIS
jgi:hypothetical protein